MSDLPSGKLLIPILMLSLFFQFCQLVLEISVTTQIPGFLHVFNVVCLYWKFQKPLKYLAFLVFICLIVLELYRPLKYQAFVSFSFLFAFIGNFRDHSNTILSFFIFKFYLLQQDTSVNLKQIGLSVC